MADTGCVELRFGIESGSDRVLKRDQKGIHDGPGAGGRAPAIEFFPRVDAFFVWGFPSRPWRTSSRRCSRWSRYG